MTGFTDQNMNLYGRSDLGYIQMLLYFQTVLLNAPVKAFVRLSTIGSQYIIFTD